MKILLTVTVDSVVCGGAQFTKQLRVLGIDRSSGLKRIESQVPIDRQGSFGETTEQVAKGFESRRTDAGTVICPDVLQHQMQQRQLVTSKELCVIVDTPEGCSVVVGRRSI